MGQSSVLAEEHVETAPETGERVVGRTPWQLFWSRFLRDKAAMAGSILIIELVLFASALPSWPSGLAMDPTTSTTT